MDTDAVHALVDVGPAVHQRAGLSRYTTSLVEAMMRLGPGRVDLRLFYNRHSGHAAPQAWNQLATSSLPMGQLAWRLSVLASSATRIPYFPLQGAYRGCDVYHATEHLLPWLPLPTVLTVHDVIFEHYPQYHTWTNRTFLRLAMPLFARRATRIIAVSRATARDLTQLYGIDADKIAVIYEGVDAAFRPPPVDIIGAVRQRYSSDRPYLLMVGTLEPRKNHALAFEVLARLKAAGYPHRLVIVGAEGWLFEPVRAQLARLDIDVDVIFTGYVPGEDLPALYAGAACFLMPSLYEGFGLPVLEAMACGAPVVCSDVSSLPELVGDAALMASPTDLDGMCAAVRRVLDNGGLADELRKRGVLRARRTSWDTAARETVEVYRAAIEASS